MQRLLARDEQALRLPEARYASTLLTVLMRLVHDRVAPSPMMRSG